MSSCFRVGGRVSHTFSTARFPRILVTGSEGRSWVGIFGGITERNFSQGSKIFKYTEKKSLEDTYTNSQLPSEHIDTSTSNKMASDEDYMAFLDKANEDPSAGISNTSSYKQPEFKTTDDDVDVPGVLVRATKDAWYISDADEPFVVVALKNEGEGLPDEETFARLIAHPSPADAAEDIQIMDIGEWDPDAYYKEIVNAIREASKGSDVRVYRIPGQGTRVEYWIVGTEGGRLVGAKALGIES